MLPTLVFSDPLMADASSLMLDCSPSEPWKKPLRIIADLAHRLPDPRSPKYIEHSAEALLTQAVHDA